MIHLRVITPEKIAFDDDVDQVSIPTPQGQITILPHHVGLITSVTPGNLILRRHQKDSFFAAGFGYAQVDRDITRILIDLAVPEEALEEKAIEEAKKQAEEQMKQKHLLSEEEYAAAAGNLQKALAQLNVKRRHRRI